MTTDWQKEVEKILIEYDMGKLPIFPGDQTAEKAIANSNKVQQSRDFAVARLTQSVLSLKAMQEESLNIADDSWHRNLLRTQIRKEIEG